MKSFFSISSALIISSMISAQCIHYGYDNAGNRASREQMSCRIGNEQPGATRGEPSDEIISTLNNRGEEGRIRIFPNPTSGIADIRIEEPEGEKWVSLSVFDLTGRRLIHKWLVGAEGNVDISSHPAGIYFVQVRTSSSTYEKILTKE